MLTRPAFSRTISSLLMFDVSAPNSRAISLPGKGPSASVSTLAMRSRVPGQSQPSGSGTTPTFGAWTITERLHEGA